MTRSEQLDSRAARPGRSGASWFGLGIRHLGERLTEALATAAGSVDRLMGMARELLDVEGAGPEIAASVQACFAEPSNRSLIEKRLAAGVRLSEE